MQQRRVLIILCILCIHVQKNRENRIKGTLSLFRAGHEDLLIHSRVIRPVVGVGGDTYLEQTIREARHEPWGREQPHSRFQQSDPV